MFEKKKKKSCQKVARFIRRHPVAVKHDVVDCKLKDSKEGQIHTRVMIILKKYRNYSNSYVILKIP